MQLKLFFLIQTFLFLKLEHLIYNKCSKALIFFAAAVLAMHRSVRVFRRRQPIHGWFHDRESYERKTSRGMENFM